MTISQTTRPTTPDVFTEVASDTREGLVAAVETLIAEASAAGHSFTWGSAHYPLQMIDAAAAPLVLDEHGCHCATLRYRR